MNELRPHVYEDPLDNRAYMDGFVSGRKSDFRDWVETLLAMDDLRKEMEAKLKEKDQLISALRGQIYEREKVIIDLESQIAAHRVAWRHRDEA